MGQCQTRSLYYKNQQQYSQIKSLYLADSKGIKIHNHFEFQPCQNNIFQMQSDFLRKFFQLELPLPGQTYFGGVSAKSDLKLLLEIATNSRLKQGQDKKNEAKQIFYCRSLGKDCFKIEVEFDKDGNYKVVDDYSKIKHKDGCEKCGESPIVIKIYNLMMLKRTLIQQFMQKQGLSEASPQVILQKISGDNGQYFYCNTITDMESRRKLKKRFDNIINISIKKKKEGKQDEQNISSLKAENYFVKVKKNGKLVGHNKKTFKKELKKLSAKDLNEPDFNDNDFCYQKPKKRTKLSSSNSLMSNRMEENVPQQEIKISNPSQIFGPSKGDSIFYEQQEDYFKKNSDINIALNMLNEAGSNNYWPQSDNSIGQGGSYGDRMRMDDLFTSIRNSLLRSLEKKSLGEIDYNGSQGFPNLQEN